MSDETSLPESDELQAAELALGLLDGEERSAAEARLATDSAFAAAHQRWQDYGVGMLRSREEAPRPSLWAAIEAKLPANDPGDALTAPAGNRGWRAATAIATAAAVVLAVMVFDRSPPGPATSSTQIASQPPMIAVLTGSDAKAVVAVSYDPSGHRLNIAPSHLDVGPKAAELWIIPADNRPRSLGVIAAAAPSSRETHLPAAALMAAGATLAISVEPKGGSPTGQPTGPVILSGKITLT